MNWDHFFATRDERQAKRFAAVRPQIEALIRLDQAILTETNSGYDPAEDEL